MQLLDYVREGRLASLSEGKVDGFLSLLALPCVDINDAQNRLLLIEASLLPDARSAGQDDRTWIPVALRSAGHEDSAANFVRLLLSRKANLAVKDRTGLLAADAVVSLAHVRVLTVLLQLLVASVAGDVEVMKQCLETPGVDVNALVPTNSFDVKADFRYRRSPLMACMRAGKETEAVRLLLQAKALYTTKDSEGVCGRFFGACCACVFS